MTAIDIVARLREVFQERRYGNCPPEYDPDFDLFDAAADEIERLRATIAQLRQVTGAVSVENFDWKTFQDLRKGSIPRYPEGPISYEIDTELAKELK